MTRRFDDFEFNFEASDGEVDRWVNANADLLKLKIGTNDLIAEILEMPDEAQKDFKPIAEISKNLRDQLLRNFERPQLGKAEIQEAFTVKNLSSLNLQEYISLLLRVPARFIVHVTRHGFKDTGSHHSLRTDTFSHGFEAMLKDGQIRSVNDQISGGKWNKDSVESKINAITASPTKAGKEDHVDQLLNMAMNANIQSEFADGTAVHAAIDYVAEAYYGGEKGNQVFAIFPAAMVASQYSSTSQNRRVPKDFKVDRLHDDKNDLWMIRNEDKRGALPLDAGILFLPADARVDPETGSIYESNESDGSLVRNDEAPLAKDTVSSREYWETYFEKNGLKPSKVIYYHGEDPNQALQAFREETGLHSKLHDDQSLTGLFPENMRSQKELASLLSSQVEAFQSFSDEVIEER
jgi:hypothetical protein